MWVLTILNENGQPKRKPNGDIYNFKESENKEDIDVMVRINNNQMFHDNIYASVEV